MRLTLGIFNHEGLYQLQNCFVAGEDVCGQNILVLSSFCHWSAQIPWKFATWASTTSTKHMFSKCWTRFSMYWGHHILAWRTPPDTQEHSYVDMMASMLTQLTLYIYICFHLLRCTYSQQALMKGECDGLHSNISLPQATRWTSHTVCAQWSEATPHPDLLPTCWILVYTSDTSRPLSIGEGACSQDMPSC